MLCAKNERDKTKNERDKTGDERDKNLDERDETGEKTRLAPKHTTPQSKSESNVT